MEENTNLESQNENEELKVAVEQANTTLMIQAPKVAFHDLVLKSRKGDCRVV